MLSPSWKLDSSLLRLEEESSRGSTGAGAGAGGRGHASQAAGVPRLRSPKRRQQASRAPGTQESGAAGSNWHAE